MGEDQSLGNSDEALPEDLRPRDSKGKELLSSLFGQVAATTVRNIIDDSVATLEKLDKMLAERVAQFTERRKQLKTMQNEDERRHVLQLLEQQESIHGSLPLEGDHPTKYCTFIARSSFLGRIIISKGRFGFSRIYFEIHSFP